MTNNNCPVCDISLSHGIQGWHYKCEKCAYEQGTLSPSINDETYHVLIDEGARENGLRDLRVHNFRQLLKPILELKPEGGKLLDVGCAHGWFLETAMDDFDVLGIEPDQRVFHMTASKGLPVYNGFFPEGLPDTSSFDVIVFNDVIEHIPDIHFILQACSEKLNKDGLLVLNLPSSDGIFYSISKIFGRLGRLGFFERLWQKGLPSPHVHYFNRKNTNLLLERSGFSVLSCGKLPTLRLSGLYTRISYTGNLNRLSKFFIYGLVAASLPFLKLLPSDIIYVIAKKNQNDS